MMNLTLFKKEIKSNYILYLIFLAVLTMYSVIIVAMFDPKLGDSLRLMAESMPEVFAAFGMNKMGTTLLEFVTTYLYGMLFVIFPSVFIIILAGRLVVKYVDNGSMAYLLAVPERRRKIISTQAVFLALSLILMVLYVTGIILLTGQMMFPGEMEVLPFLRVNIGLLGVLLFFGGVCFLSSCLFNDTKRAYGIASGVVIYSILLQMISQVGDKAENLKYATPLTLFSIDGLTAGEASAYGKCAILYIAGIVFMALGVWKFSRRNLPL